MRSSIFGAWWKITPLQLCSIRKNIFHPFAFCRGFFYESAEKAPTSSFSLNKFNKRLCTDKGERPKERERKSLLRHTTQPITQESAGARLSFENN
jgi:hypothetical protein